MSDTVASDFTEHDIGLALLLEKCAPDWETSTREQKLAGFMFFCENFGHIKHPSRGKIPFNLRPAQIETVESWLDNRYSIVLKARQIGFSTLVSIFCFWLTFFYSDRHIIMLSRTEREASKLLSHSKYLYSNMPDWLRHVGPAISFTQTKCEMSNNSALESMPSANDPARGSTAFLIVVDEIAFLQNSDEAWASIEPVVDVGGSCIMLSTANGEGNLFHKLWSGAKAKTNQFVGVFFPWHASDRDQAWFDAKCAELPEWQRAQEYPQDEDEAFLKSGRPVFDLQALRDMQTSEPARGRLERDVDGQIVWEEDGGSLAVWKMPEPGAMYVIGADVAFGLEHGDYSCAHVLDVRTGLVVAEWWGKADPDLFGSHVLANLGHFYNRALLGVENNNHGLTTVTALQRVKYPNLFRQRGKLNVRKVRKTDTFGWNTNRTSKPLMINGLAAAIRDGDIRIASEGAIAELRTYVRDGDGKTHGSPHDDRVMSLAVTVQMVTWCYLPEYKPAPAKPGPGTVGFEVDKLFAKQKVGKRTVHIGQFAGRSR